MAGVSEASEYLCPINCECRIEFCRDWVHSAARRLVGVKQFHSGSNSEAYKLGAAHHWRGAPEICSEVLCDSMESSLSGCSRHFGRFSWRENKCGAAISAKYVPGDALAHDWADARWANACSLWGA